MSSSGGPIVFATEAAEGAYTSVTERSVRRRETLAVAEGVFLHRKKDSSADVQGRPRLVLVFLPVAVVVSRRFPPRQVHQELPRLEVSLAPLPRFEIRARIVGRAPILPQPRLEWPINHFLI